MSLDHWDLAGTTTADVTARRDKGVNHVGKIPGDVAGKVRAMPGDKAIAPAFGFGVGMVDKVAEQGGDVSAGIVGKARGSPDQHRLRHLRGYNGHHECHLATVAETARMGDCCAEVLQQRRKAARIVFVIVDMVTARLWAGSSRPRQVGGDDPVVVCRQGTPVTPGG